jgi:histidinol phosphatase-like enzyme
LIDYLQERKFKQSIMIGDSVTDLEFAKGLKMTAFRVTNFYSKAKLWSFHQSWQKKGIGLMEFLVEA